MRLKQLLDRRAGYSLASLGLLLSMAAPAVVPAFASAAELTQRSITMSTSATGATNVSYNLKFTGTGAIDGTTENGEGGIIIDFCSNTAVLGDDCTRPAGMVTSGVGVTGVEYDGSPAGSNGSVASGSNGHIVWTAGADYAGGGDTFDLTLTGITNPTDPGVFYARITTYADDTALTSYQAVNGDVGDYSDEGSIALAATAGVGVTSYVLEAMSFCVSLGNVGDSDVDDDDAVAANEQPSVNCGENEVDCDADEVGNPDVQPGCVIAPSMTLGEDDGSGNIVLNSSKIFTGQIWAQLSSNARGNTVVNLKSDATDCGGLYRNGNPANCDIPPQTSDSSSNSITAGTAGFGLRVGSASAAPLADGNPGNGSGTIATDANYHASNYFIDFVDDDEDGVTSTYGSPIFSTTGPVDNMNVPVTFGATISNNTPAGTYGATFSLIAVGTF